MDTLRKYLHEEVLDSRLQDEASLADLGIRHRYVPDEISEFDEVELAAPLDDERDLVLTLALEDGRIERILLGWAPAGNDDDDMRVFSEESLAALVDSRGEEIALLLAHLTGS